MEQAEQKKQRIDMAKELFVGLMIDLILLAMILGFLLRAGTEIKECSENLFKIGLTFIIYQACTALRTFLIFYCSWRAKKPKDASHNIRFALTCVDSVAWLSIAGWVTHILLNDEQVAECRNQ